MATGAWLWAATTPSLAPWPVHLQSVVVKETRRFDGELALVVKDLGSGLRYTHNAATPMYLASGIKIIEHCTVIMHITPQQVVIFFFRNSFNFSNMPHIIFIPEFTFLTYSNQIICNFFIIYNKPYLFC